MSDEQRIQFLDLLHGAVPSFQRAFRCGCGKDFEEYGIYGYITKYFESLHTMGDHCIVQDIDDYISSITGNNRIKRNCLYDIPQRAESIK